MVGLLAATVLVGELYAEWASFNAAASIFEVLTLCVWLNPFRVEGGGGQVMLGLWCVTDSRVCLTGGLPDQPRH